MLLPTVCFLSLYSSTALLTLSNTVGSSMVIQRDSPTTSLWGLSNPGTVVTATLSSGASYNATSDAAGVWRVKLPSMPPNATPQNISFTAPGETSIDIEDVLFGDVVLCSGQSNMALSIEMALNSTAELAAIDAFGPVVRFLKVGGGGGSVTPQRDITPAQAWSRVSAAGMGQSGFSGFR
jgi:sialate O-acetylesterase